MSATAHGEGTAPQQATPGFGWSTILGYGAGDAANNLIFMTATMFLMVYYTDSAGLSAAAVGTLMLVVRVFDAFADVFAGQLVDRAKTRWGKFRPFILFASIPLLVTLFLVFHVPDTSHGGKLFYAYVTYAAMGLAYSLVNIPYGSLAAAITQVPGERAKLAAARTVGALLVSTSLGMFVSPLLSVDADLQQIFTRLTLGFILVGFLLYLWTFFTTRETVEREVERVNLKQGVKSVITNKPLLILAGTSVLFLTGMFGVSTLQIYYFRDVLGALTFTAYMALGSLLITVVMAFASPRLIAKLGKRKLYVIGAAVMAVGGLIVFFAPTSSPWPGFLGTLVMQTGIVTVNMLVWSLEADTIEYGDLHSGVRAEGLSYSVFTFSRKVGQAIGGALGGYALALGAYVAGNAMTDQLSLAIRAGIGLIPFVMAVLAGLVMMRYPLTENVHSQIMKQIAERNAARHTAAS